MCVFLCIQNVTLLAEINPILGINNTIYIAQ